MKLKVEVKIINGGFNGLKEEDFTHPMYGVFANEDIREGGVVHVLGGTWIHKPNRASIQIGEKHLDSPIGGYVNHSCEPNCMLIIQLQDMGFRNRYVPMNVGIKGTLTSMIISNPKPVLVAKQPIFKGSEITFDYNTTEDLLAQPFKCTCNTQSCIEYIGGKHYKT